MAGTLSGTSPLPQARNTTLYYYTLPDYFPTVKDLTNNESISELSMHPIARTVCRLGLLYLCRVSELLLLTVAQVYNPDRVICHGAKRSRSYMIYLPGLSASLEANNITDPAQPLFPISYIKCYRSYLKAGIRFVKKGATNSARTHVGRYAVQELEAGGTEVSVLSDLLHHKSKSSILYYLNK